MGGCGPDHVAQDKDQWRAVVNTVVNLNEFHKMLGIFYTL
jgi:hypothetical protein